MQRCTDRVIEEGRMLLLELSADATRADGKRRPCTTKDVAERLAMLHMRGACGDRRCCPIANYLRRHTGAHAWRVSHAFAWLEGHRESEEIELPAVVKRFVDKFDTGNYPSIAFSEAR